MANIPTIPGSAQVQDQSIGTKVNVQPRLQALGQFRQTVGKADAALNEGMAGIEDYELRKRKAEEAATFNETSIKLMKATGDFRHTLKTQKDDEILPNWTNASSQLKEQITSEPSFAKMSPRAQAKLKMHLDSWQGQSSAEFQVAADKLGSQRRRATASAASDEFLKTGDPAMMKNAEAAISAAVKAGDMTPEEGSKRTSQFPQLLQKNQILNGIDSDPYRTLQDINAGKFKNVPEQELNTLRNAAEKQTNYVQRATGDDYVGKFQTSGIPENPAALQADVKAGKLTGEFVKNYNAMVAQKDRHEAENTQALILNRIRDTDFSASKNPASDMREISDEAAKLPPEFQKSIKALLDNRKQALEKKQVQEERYDVQRELASMKDSYFKSVTRIPISPSSDTEPARRAESVQAIQRMSDEKFHATFGEDADKDQVVASAKNFVQSEHLRYAKAQAQFLDWAHSKQGANATPQAAADERERLGFGVYSTQDDVVASYTAGKIDRATAKEILNRQFGVP